MRCKYLRAIAFTAAILGVLVCRFAAADDGGQPSSTPSLGEAMASDSEASSAKPATSVPTLARRRTDADTPPAELTPKGEPAGESAASSESPVEKSKEKPAAERLEPVPDQLGSDSVAVEAASFKGVTPGVSTKEDVEKAWGKPKDVSQKSGAVVQLYSIAPFNRLEVNYAGEKVSSIVIRFDQPFPADVVAKQLDLGLVRPVPVSSELGEVLGSVYPERGVMFGFQPSDTPSQPSMKVMQIVLEPITAEPFVLRAEATMDDHQDLAIHDLEQALVIEPGNARCHWLHARLLMAAEQYEKAATAAAEAVRFDPANCQYRVTRAQALAQVGRFPEALVEAQKAVEGSEKRPHVRARALCLIGDLSASGPKPDYKKALASHTQAIQMADPLTSDPHPAIRVAAKQVLVDAHLGAAHDIAWGEWKEKDKAVVRWLQRAVTVSEDLVKNDGASRDVVLRVHSRALAACVGLHGTVDPEPAAKAIVATGDELIAAASDPARKARLQLEVGTALYDAVQIWQMRSDQRNAFKYGEVATQYLAKAREATPSASSSFLMGRLCFRLGAIHAIQDRNHRAAVEWFDKAIPLLSNAAPEQVATDVGRHGEAFISMGVSYWEVGQRQKAVDLTEKGVKWIEQAAKQGSIDKSALVVPYSNLAAMHRQLGSNEMADRFQEMASRAKTGAVK